MKELSKENVYGLSDMELNIKETKLAYLTDKITELRAILNELYTTLEVGETNPTILAVSEYMDKLIVEYMKEIN